jgi:phosphatidylglycerol lysyltransferase
MRQLKHISDVWLQLKASHHTSEMGFSTGRLEELPEIARRAETRAGVVPFSITSHGAAPRVVTEVAVTASGQPCAFVTFIPVYGSLTAPETGPANLSKVENWGWALDLMRRTPDAPPGIIELLLVRAIEGFRSCGAHTVSLGMAAMADTHHEMTSWQRQLTNFAIDRLHLLENRRTLFNFKQKFHPRWESRYIVTKSTLGLPRIAKAIGRLRNY